MARTSAPQATDQTARLQQAKAAKREADAAAARMTELQAQGQALVDKAEGVHAEAAVVAKDVAEKRTEKPDPIPATNSAPSVTAAETTASTSQPASPSNPRLEQFVALLGIVGYKTDPIVKDKIDAALKFDGGNGKFSTLGTDRQEALIAWLADLNECRVLATELGLDDAKLEKMLANAGCKKVEHLNASLAVVLRDKLKGAIEARKAAAGQAEGPAKN